MGFTELKKVKLKLTTFILPHKRALFNLSGHLAAGGWLKGGCVPAGARRFRSQTQSLALPMERFLCIIEIDRSLGGWLGHFYYR
jgi:hypothetical protein